jgi:hypothetical protein
MKNKIKKIKVIDYFQREKIIIEANLKSVHEINGIEIAIAKSENPDYPFAAYYKRSGNLIGQRPHKLLKEVLPDLKEKLQWIFNHEQRREDFLLTISQKETINLDEVENAK